MKILPKVKFFLTLFGALCLILTFVAWVAFFLIEKSDWESGVIRDKITSPSGNLIIFIVDYDRSFSGSIKTIAYVGPNRVDFYKNRSSFRVLFDGGWESIKWENDATIVIYRSPTQKIFRFDPHIYLSEELEPGYYLRDEHPDRIVAKINTIDG